MAPLKFVWTFATLFCIGFLTINVNSQVYTAVEQRIREDLQKLVNFVVDPTATLSQGIVDFALVKGNQPKTHAERMQYVDYLTAIARNTPKVAQRFKTGTIIDETALGSHITLKAMEYVEKQKKEKAAAAAAATPAPVVPAAPGVVQPVNNQQAFGNNMFGNQFGMAQNPNDGFGFGGMTTDGFNMMMFR